MTEVVLTAKQLLVGLNSNHNNYFIILLWRTRDHAIAYNC